MFSYHTHLKRLDFGESLSLSLCEKISSLHSFLCLVESLKRPIDINTKNKKKIKKKEETIERKERKQKKKRHINFKLETEEVIELSYQR